RGAACERPSSWPLLACLHLLLAGDRTLGSAAAAGVGPGALAAHGQPAAVPHAAVRADLGQALDVVGHIASQVTFDEELLGPRHLVDDLAQTSDLFVGEILDARVGVDAGRLHELLSGG